MSLTHKWLRLNAQPYSHSDRVFTDVDAALTRFHTLRPKSDIYTYDDGRTQLLLCIHGLLPISFRNASYNIPVAIWLTRDYPQQPPIAYVVPTNDMLVKAGKYVDVSGKCDVEYSQHWVRKSEGCSLSALLEAMQEQFSREPPVYAKPPDNISTATVSQQRAFQDYSGRPPPPLPPTPTPASSSPAPIIPDRPVLPPKPAYIPAQPVGGPSVHAVHPPFSSHTPVGSVSTADAAFPPRLPVNTGPPQYKRSHENAPVPPNYNAPTSVGVPGSDVATSSSQISIDNSRLPISSFTANPPILYSQAPPSDPASLRSHGLPSFPNLLDDDSPDVHVPHISQTPLPPRPPNPELLYLHAKVYQKMSSELGSLEQALALDAERLRAHQTDLLAGEPAIRDEMARLEAVRTVCLNVSGRMRGIVDAAQLNVAELRRKGDPEVDELVCSTTIVHNQIISLVAEDNAIEDTIYHLHRALNTGRIDLERFLRSTRLLAEEQFMKRALIEKIQQGMPIGSQWH